MRDQSKTTAGVQSGSVACCEPEFIQVQDAVRFSGVGRTTLYSLISDGKIKTVNLRRPGTARGRRLVYLPSLREYLMSFQEGGAA